MVILSPFEPAPQNGNYRLSQDSEAQKKDPNVMCPSHAASDESFSTIDAAATGAIDDTVRSSFPPTLMMTDVCLSCRYLFYNARGAGCIAIRPAIRPYRTWSASDETFVFPLPRRRLALFI